MTTARTVAAAGRMLAERATSAAQLAADAYERVDKFDPMLNAFLATPGDAARAQAASVDASIDAGGGVRPLAGVPVAIKDNLCLAGDHPTTAGSRMLESYKSPYTATAVQRLIDAGAVIIGKTNMDEFAMGSSGENSAFGPTRNPWDMERVPGGSSSGSAAAVAAGIVPVALGSDTGGSIRQPAGHCGIVGLKPTYGRVSRYGLVAFASSLDQIGPLGRTVEDVAAVLSVISGHDPLDSTSADHAVPNFTKDLDRPIDGFVLGVPRQARSAANHPAVAAALASTIKTYQSLGATIVDVDLPHAAHGIAAYYIVALAEASSNLARFDGVRYGHRAYVPADVKKRSYDSPLSPPLTGDRLYDTYSVSRAEGFGPEVQRRVMLGTYILSSGYYDAYYTTALKVRRRIKADYDAAFASPCHAILMPASPSPAFKLGEKASDPMAMYLEDVYTVGVNLAGLPGICIPAGFAQEGGSRLPIGMQLIGPAWREHELLRAARMFEVATEFHLAQSPCAAETSR
jgi:aspartyl-tRNA(Asn)/glutamyl-tRNA(Gln) amidotransferase subunit A